MRVFKKIALGVIIFISIAYILPSFLLQFPYFQQKLSYQISSYLTKKLQTEVTIRQIELGFLNKLILKDVNIKDLSGEILFQAKRVAAGFDFFPLLQKKLRFNSIQLFSFELNLCKETDNSPLNIQHIIDAFAKKDTATVNPAIDLRIKQLNLRLGTFSYKVKDKPETPGILNFKQLLLNDISSKIHIHNLNNQELALQISKLSFKEQSGLQLKNLNFNIVANEKEAKIDKLVIELEKSILQFTDISSNFNFLFKSENKAAPVEYRFKLITSSIYPKELIAFAPVFSNFDDRISLDGDFFGNGNNLVIKNFYFRYYNQIMINANADLQNFFNFNQESFHIRGSVSSSFFTPEGLERMVNSFSRTPVELPKQIKQMKNIRFEGGVIGSIDNLSARGVWNTDLGTVNTNITLGKNETRFLKGQISSESLNMEKLLNNTDYGDMNFDITIDAKQNNDKKFYGAIDANFAKFDYKGYSYRNLTLNGDFTPTSFDGRLNLNSPEGKISGKGLLSFKGKDSKFDFHADVSDLQLDKLNLTKKYKNPVLSFGIIADLSGNNIDNFAGDISINNLLFETDKASYYLDSLKISSTISEQEKCFKIDSEILKGRVTGIYSFKTLIPELKQTLAVYLPTLIKPDSKYSGNKETNFTLSATMNDMTDFSKAFELPFTLQKNTDIFGKYNGDDLYFEITTPHAIIGGTHTDSIRLLLNNFDKTASVNLSGISLQKKNARVKFNLQSDASNDKVKTLLHWGNSSTNYRGDLRLTTLFSKKENRSPVRIETNIMQTDLVFNDSIWTLYPSAIVIDSANIRIDHLHAAHNDQFLKINGTVSKNPDEELQIELNRINLEYIFQSLSIPALEFGGTATGFVNAQDLFKSRKMETNLKVDDFSFNNVRFGHLDLIGEWDNDEQGVLMIGNVMKNDSSFVNVNGYIFPAKEEISINFDAKNADARFLRKYLDDVVKDLTGNLSGHLRLFGYWNTPTVEGDVFASKCRFRIEYINTFYTFSDSVKCLPDNIIANNISIYDDNGNKVIANGYIKHDLFQTFNYYATVTGNNFMVLNTNKYLNPMFYGLAYGNGSANIYGTENVINIDVNMQNTGNTKITLNFMEEPEIENFDFIRFVPVKTPSPEQQKKQNLVSKQVASNSGPEIKLELLFNATPQATIEMIMDPLADDKITGYGNGNLRIQYGTKIPLKVTGNYIIEHGKYYFSLQQFFIRNFDIKEGSTVIFQGDPYTAKLDIKAYYTVNANLEDLDRQLIENKRSARNTVPVNCFLLLSGPLDRPNIGFDLELPGATDELVREVKSYIRTEDMMNRQIIYLLALSRFYTPPENMRDNNAVVNSNWSYLTSTLSTQLSSIFGSLSDNFQLGTSFHQSNVGTQTKTEFDLLLSSQLLNNRLIINGNFGYSSNPYLNRQYSIPLIGDFDLEYKLTQSGDIRLKGYNHYNYRNYYSITPEMTQGLGILFRKDFSHWLDLFGRRRGDAKKP